MEFGLVYTVTIIPFDGKTVKYQILRNQQYKSDIFGYFGWFLMTYKLQEIISKISSPVVLLIDGEERYQFDNGIEAYEQDYDHYYLIEEIYTKSGKIYIALRENNQTNDVNWCGEQEVSFF